MVALEPFDGIFKDSEGQLHDLRPQEGIPTLSKFNAMDKPFLWKLLKTAYSAQLAELS